MALNTPVLLTRPAEQLASSQALLSAAGYKVLALPLMAIAAPSRPPSAALRAWVESAHWLVFTSRNAVNAAVQWWPHAASFKSKPKIAAIGAATATALREQNWPVDVVSTGGTSESLLQTLSIGQSSRIALMSGSGGRRHLKHSLQAQGHDVRKLLLYRRVGLDWPIDQLQNVIDADPLAVFSSGFALRQWAQLMRHHNLPQGLNLNVLVASTRLCKLANLLGFSARFEALPTMSDTALLNALNEWNS